MALNLLNIYYINGVKKSKTNFHHFYWFLSYLIKHFFSIFHFDLVFYLLIFHIYYINSVPIVKNCITQKRLKIEILLGQMRLDMLYKKALKALFRKWRFLGLKEANIQRKKIWRVFFAEKYLFLINLKFNITYLHNR